MKAEYKEGPEARENFERVARLRSEKALAEKRAPHSDPSADTKPFFERCPLEFWPHTKRGFGSGGVRLQILVVHFVTQLSELFGESKRNLSLLR